MNKKHLNCLACVLLFAISFLFPGFTEAAQLPKEMLSLSSHVAVALTSPELKTQEAAALEGGSDRDKPLFGSAGQSGPVALTPDNPFNGGSSELIRRLPLAVLLTYSVQLACRPIASQITYSFSRTLAAAPGLPVLLRSLRL